MEEILTYVQSGLSSVPPPPTTDNSSDLHPTALVLDEPSALDGSLVYPEDVHAHYEEFVFDDVGEGAGVEGDLDMEDD